jgi:hypothetical protein
MTTFSGSPQVYTYRWSEARNLPSFYVPIRISIGCPRYWPEAKSLDAIHELMPYEILGRVHGAKAFEARYRQRMDGFGVERVQRRFERLFERHSERPLVLCCYEDLHQVGAWCHRSMFRRWWEDATGAVIDELQFAGADPDLAEPVESAPTEPPQLFAA